jgi:hypothetical protein
MVDRPGLIRTTRWRLVLPLAALGLALAAWSIFCLGKYRVSQLDLSRFGPCEEVFEALRRDGYTAEFLLPYFAVAVLLDGMALVLAIVGLLVAVVDKRFRILGVLVALFVNASGAYHLVGWLVSSAFSG